MAITPSGFSFFLGQTETYHQWLNALAEPDLNQDGISQSNELKTLNQLNIKSIGTIGEKVVQNLGNDNQAIAQGSFTFNDGQTSTLGFRITKPAEEGGVEVVAAAST